jgi:hypothetical protein
MRFREVQIESLNGEVKIYESILEGDCGTDVTLTLPPEQAIIVGKEIIRLAKDIKRQQAEGRNNG